MTLTEGALDLTASLTYPTMDDIIRLMVLKTTAILDITAIALKAKGNIMDLTINAPKSRGTVYLLPFFFFFLAVSRSADFELKRVESEK